MISYVEDLKYKFVDPMVFSKRYNVIQSVNSIIYEEKCNVIWVLPLTSWIVWVNMLLIFYDTE